MLLVSGIICFLLGFSIWNGGIVQATGKTVINNLTNSTVTSFVETINFSAVNLGYKQSYLAIIIVFLGVFFFIQAIGGFIQSENK